LDSKISSSRIKLNSLKKRVPENIQLIDSAEQVTKTDLDEIRSTILETSPELETSLIDKSTKNSFDLSKSLKINSKLFVFDVIYLDGTKKSISLIEHEISNSLEGSKDFSLYLRWPESLIDGPKVTLKNSDYSKEKDDLLSFGKDTKKITYQLDKKLDTDVLSGIFISPIQVAEESPSITGYFLNLPGTDSLGTTFLIIVASTLGIYLLYVRKKKGKEDTFIQDFILKAREVKQLNKEGKAEEASTLYESLQSDYIGLSPEEKRKVFREVKSLASSK